MLGEPQIYKAQASACGYECLPLVDLDLPRSRAVPGLFLRWHGCKMATEICGSYHLAGKATRLSHSAHFDQGNQSRAGCDQDAGKEALRFQWGKPGRGQTNPEAGPRHHPGAILSAGTSQRRGGSSGTTLVRSRVTGLLIGSASGQWAWAPADAMATRRTSGRTWRRAGRPLRRYSAEGELRRYSPGSHPHRTSLASAARSWERTDWHAAPERQPHPGWD